MQQLQHVTREAKANLPGPSSQTVTRPTGETNGITSRVRNGKLEIIGYRETGSGKREVLRDKNGGILGRFESDTKVTRDASGTITGRGSNQLLRLLK